ncbi:DUF1351 domain-containing protein [Acinetobacter baumannii]|uniref:DUF1351 domain-containing protein n=2 Tax=Acinetobacter baumannii TaxID=470 RepID=A0A6I4ID20_ACIBA|nr:DUF1351 domain-containing protein [Acinetobacter baumannii]HBD0869101.1 DUF1351 domain-containing protein [Enterococcus faecalis]
MGAKLMTNELTTELQFSVDFKASEITIQNEVQLASIVDSAVEHYSTMIFTDENIPDAKKARADLKKVSDLLENQRKNIKKEYSEPLKKFEDKIKKYTGKINLVRSSIDENIKSYEETERNKRNEKLQEVIAEMSENYGVDINEFKISDSWLNKTSFTAKGELTKKTIEEIATVMYSVAKEKERIKNDKLIVENYAKAVGLDSFSWVALIDKGSTAPELIKEIDSAVALKKEQEERERAKREHDEAMSALKTETINNKTVDTATGEIITEKAPKTSKKQQEKTVTLRLTAEHQKLVALNNFIINNGIQVEVIE